MDDRKRTLAAISLIAGFFLIVAIIIGVLVTGKKVLSPIPDDPAIKIMFISPTVIPLENSPVGTAPTLSSTVSPTGKPASKQ